MEHWKVVEKCFLLSKETQQNSWTQKSATPKEGVLSLAFLYSCFSFTHYPLPLPPSSAAQQQLRFKLEKLGHAKVVQACNLKCFRKLCCLRRKVSSCVRNQNQCSWASWDALVLSKEISFLEEVCCYCCFFELCLKGECQIEICTRVGTRPRMEIYWPEYIICQNTTTCQRIGRLFPPFKEILSTSLVIQFVMCFSFHPIDSGKEKTEKSRRNSADVVTSPCSCQFPDSHCQSWGNET